MTDDAGDSDPSTWDPAFDAVTAAPVHHKVLFENDKLRVRIAAIVPRFSPPPPDVRLTDLGDWTTAATAAAGRRFLMARTFACLQPIKLEDWFAAEAQLLGCYFGLDASGLPALRQIGVPTSLTPTAITSTHELTSQGRSGFERNVRGAINIISIATRYDPLTNEWKGQPIQVWQGTSRGRSLIPAPVEIKPYSNAALSYGISLGGYPPSAEEVADYTRTAQALLGIFGYPYATITVSVPFTHFDVLTGSLVQLTSATLPDDDLGQRGMTARVGYVTGRKVDFGRGVITLTVLCPEANIAGYAPATRISAISLVSGTTYDLTIDPSNPTGYADVSVWSDIQTLAAGNDVIVQWRQWNTTSVAANVDGLFVGVVGGKLRVTFTGAISLAAGTFNLCFANTTAGLGPPEPVSQQRYCYQAGSDGVIDWQDGTKEPARVFAA